MQTLRIKIFPTPYYSSSRGWAILLYESFIENQIFSIFHFFSKNVQNFVTAKDLAIIYRPRRYLAQNHRWNLLYPKIKSDRNLNGWSRVKNSHVHWKGPDLSPALRITICPDTVLLFEPRINYPALRVPPGGNQVDGLPPAFSTVSGKIVIRRAGDKSDLFSANVNFWLCSIRSNFDLTLFSDKAGFNGDF